MPAEWHAPWHAATGPACFSVIKVPPSLEAGPPPQCDWCLRSLFSLQSRSYARVRSKRLTTANMADCKSCKRKTWESIITIIILISPRYVRRLRPWCKAIKWFFLRWYHVAITVSAAQCQLRTKMQTYTEENIVFLYCVLFMTMLTTQLLPIHK